MAAGMNEPAADRPDSALTLPGRAEPVISVRGLCKRFGAFVALKDVDLDAYEGETVCIVGGSGSGKSTLLRCINMLETPDEGEIRIEGERMETVVGRGGRVRPKSQRQLNAMRSRVGMVFQGFNLWRHMSILENLIEAPQSVLGLSRREAVERAERLLVKVGLVEKRNSYPDFLSGGQKQRAAIARALAMEPRALLLDEPTSALDPVMVREVLDLMAVLSREGMTMLCVTHEIGFARKLANRVVVMKDGRIVRSGRPAAMLENGFASASRPDRIGDGQGT